MDKVSYALGLGIGQQLAQMGASDLNIDDFADAIKDVINGNELKVPHKDAQTIVQEYFRQQEERINAIRAEQGKAAKAEGEKFLAENGKKEGVVTLKSGLQYEVLREGNGKKPKATDQVKCHYEGTLINGQVFDSSYKRNPQTTTFGLNQVIKGWTEALQLMPVGSKWEIYIPYDLAYGERGSGRNIKPYEALIFTVELVDIEKPKAEVKVEEKTATKKATAKKGITMKATPKAKKK